VVVVHIRLADGRRLGFAELGDPLGAPIIHHHGMPGSRLDRAGSNAVYHRHGVRVVTPDRPGYGLSDPLPNGSLMDWPRDVAELADSLQMESFGVTGLSGGGIYALACAALIPERVTNVVVTGCPSPLERPEALSRMRPLARSGVWLGRHAPGVLAAAAGALAGAIRRFPGFFITGATSTNSPSDRRWLDDAAFKAGEKESIREAFRQGGAGYVKDVRLLSRPWGFAPEEIRVPVELWHGDHDTVMPPFHSADLAGEIGGSLLVVCPGEGHMLMWNHLEEILDAAARGPLSLSEDRSRHD
jgi:pimeloyl-ACP methyl ester carboxylesterase